MTSLRRWGYALMVGWGLAAGIGCQGFFEQPDSSKPVTLRVENATSRFLEVSVTVSELDSESPPDSPVEATDESSERAPGRELPVADPAEAEPAAPAASEPTATDDAATSGVDESPEFVTIGLRPHVEAKLTLAEGVVRVFPESFTEGEIACGDLVSLNATLEGDSSAEVLLEGAGAGTLGFDEGSAGPSGERLLLSSVHFECGGTIVVRVTDWAALGAAASGKIEVFAAGEPVPPPVVDDPSEPPSVGSNQVEVRVSNATGSYAQLRILTGAEADAAEGDSASEPGIVVRVPPGLLSTGLIACASRIVLEAAIVVPGVAVGEPDTFNQVVLSGEGTGTAGFDENSTGISSQQRVLLEGSQYHCGGVIQVGFTSDGNPGTENETLGAATVSVIE